MLSSASISWYWEMYCTWSSSITELQCHEMNPVSCVDDEPPFLRNIIIAHESWCFLYDPKPIVNLPGAYHQHPYVRWSVTRTNVDKKWCWRYFSTAVLLCTRNSFRRDLTWTRNDKPYATFCTRSSCWKWRLTPQLCCGKLFSRNWSNMALLCYMCLIFYTLPHVIFCLHSWRQCSVVTILTVECTLRPIWQRLFTQSKEICSRAASEISVPICRDVFG